MIVTVASWVRIKIEICSKNKQKRNTIIVTMLMITSILSYGDHILKCLLFSRTSLVVLSYSLHLSSYFPILSFPLFLLSLILYSTAPSIPSSASTIPPLPNTINSSPSSFSYYSYCSFLNLILSPLLYLFSSLFFSLNISLSLSLLLTLFFATYLL